MKNLFVALALSLTLVGCGTFGGPVHQGPDPAVDQTDQVAVAISKVQNVIDEANVARISVNRTITKRVTSGAWSKAQAQTYLNKSKTYGADVKKAQKWLDEGSITAAQGKAALVRELIKQLTIEVAKQIAKETL